MALVALAIRAASRTTLAKEVLVQVGELGFVTTYEIREAAALAIAVGSVTI